MRDTNAESFLIAGCGKLENTADFFAAADGRGIEWKTIRTAHDPAWPGVELHSDVRTRIEHDLADGYVIMVPRDAAFVDGDSRIGWWKIDPKTGETLGIGRNGQGDAAENAFFAAVLVIPLAFIICIPIVGSDSDGVTPQDGVVCALGSYAAGIGVAAAVGSSVVAGIIAALLGIAATAADRFNPGP